MEEYYFLFALVILYALFAVIQDLKKMEVANWLNFTLVGFALAYRAFYSITNQNSWFFLSGLFGALIFFAVGLIFYYSGAFGGGDVKLLAGIGAVLPYQTHLDVWIVSIEFLVITLFVGAIYSVLYSVILAVKNKKIFLKEFKRLRTENRKLLIYSWITALIIGIVSYYWISYLSGFVVLFLVILPVLYVYLKALDKCMIVKLKPGKLTEGDWILEDIKLKNYIVKKTVHGLTLKDIKMLKKARKEIYIKTGIPFVPAVFVALIIMGYVFLVLKLNLLYLFVP